MPPAGALAYPRVVPTAALRRTAALLGVLALVAVLIGGCAGGQTTPPVRDTAAPADPGLDQGLVHTRTGALRGQIAPDHLLFQDIPYAAPPVGPLRWQPPRPAPPWPGVRDAASSGPRCIQDSRVDPGFGRTSNEDCLSLNVWSPTGASALPVMVWIHGGGFVNGSGDIYDAEWLTTKGHMVVVTVNYRLGAPGFLAHPDLGPPDEVGNYGLADQQAALRWVRDNIAAFGGDPAKVTIAGESAGAMSVCDHLVAPGSQGLFRAAILQSGPCQVQADPVVAQRVSREYARAVGCGDPSTTARCLRALPAAALVDPPWYLRIGTDRLSGPVTGTRMLPMDPPTAIRAGRAARVPVLIGSNADEFTLFMALRYLRTGREPSAAAYPGMLADAFGGHAGDIARRYAPERFGGDVSLAYATAVTDGVFACPAAGVASGLAAHAPVYAYEFSDRTAPAPAPLRTVPFPVGAAHSLELRYLFDVGGAPPLSPVQRRLSDQMIGYWSHFVATGVPGYPGAPVWPALSGPGGQQRMTFTAQGPRVRSDFGVEHQCPFWAGLAG
ncbi:carboxylesterase/lipase family protein [Mycolicibacterium palauense]|uniref:carboxylesterase/lipase family protein n=1 Tax=Mycolicibacterium palauense TaxID=2034511 RepID=UPI000BFF1943|nr:carboxylesterase family protein [Mycolicibacterium palauense]